MDDGTKVGKGLKFCTNGFLKEDIELLSTVLKSKYNLVTTIHSAGTPHQ
jgi:hypothetical protein